MTGTGTVYLTIHFFWRENINSFILIPGSVKKQLGSGFGFKGHGSGFLAGSEFRARLPEEDDPEVESGPEPEPVHHPDHLQRQHVLPQIIPHLHTPT